uniref:Uncharacterized protein n=1 Tax=Meloidogyne enterolobii TaxID=390850 RepID=A0A6V7XRQ4_MELEN|nr:unnamed protein product [Meloidogyne enterolobii]
MRTFNSMKMLSICQFVLLVFPIFILHASKGVPVGVIPNIAPLQAKFPINHNVAKAGQNRNGSALKVNSSASSNKGTVHLAMEHYNNPQSVIVSQSQKQFIHPATLDKKVLEQNAQHANANEHYKLEETKDERYTNVGEEEYLLNALSEAITNKSPMKIYSKFFHEFVNMIQGDQPTVSKFKLNPGFKKYILKNGRNTILELSEYDNLKENHTKFLQKALDLYDEEVRLEKYKMAGNKLSNEEKEESLKNMTFEGTTEEKLMKEILNVLNVLEPEQSLIGIMSKHVNVLDQCINFLKHLFSNDFDVVADNDTKTSRTMKLEMIGKMETLKKILNSTQKILLLIKHERI